MIFNTRNFVSIFTILQQKTSCPCLKEEYHIACNEISRSYHQTWMKFKCIPEWAKILLLEKRLVDETERGQIAMTTLGRCIFVWSISLSCLRFYLMWNDLHYYYFFGSKIDFQTKNKIKSLLPNSLEIMIFTYD